MENKKDVSSFKLEAAGILEVVKKWWKPLLVVGGVSIILSAIFSSPAFIKPLFKSTAILYPSNMVPYATENPTEQMLQMFESEDIRDHLIRDFDLFKHYDIDTTAKYPLTALHNMMKERIDVSKTEYESAEIIIYDTDPVIASRMCDSMMSYLNQKVISLQRSKYAEVVRINKNQLDLKHHEMDSMELEMKKLRTDYGIIDFDGQVRPFAKAYYKALSEGKAGEGSPLAKVKNNLAEKGGEYISLKEHLWRTRGNFNDIKIAYEGSLKDLTKELTYCNVVTHPYPAEKKSSPIRTLLILGFTAAMMFISFLIIIVIEKTKENQSA